MALPPIPRPPTNMALLIFYFLLALVVSFFCSLMEAVILSIRAAHVQMLLNEGSRAGPLLKRLKSRLDLPLAAILTLNTIANVVGSAGVGAVSAREFGSQWVGITAAILTVCILVGSEIIPKTLGARYWKPLSVPAAYLILGMIILLYPAVFLLNLISRVVSGGEQTHMITRDEMMVMTEMSGASGAIEKTETTVIGNILRLGNVLVKDVMTPRVEVLTLEKGLTVGEVLDTYSPIRHSRLPVHDTTPDKIIGKVLTRHLLELRIAGKDHTPVGRIKSDLAPVPETATVARVLDEFIRKDMHMFYVVNEYGGTEGIITLEDAVETMLGVEIVDEMDHVADLRTLAREKMLARRKQLMIDDDDAIDPESIDS